MNAGAVTTDVPETPLNPHVPANPRKALLFKSCGALGGLFVPPAPPKLSTSPAQSFLHSQATATMQFPTTSELLPAGELRVIRAHF